MKNAKTDSKPEDEDKVNVGMAGFYLLIFFIVIGIAIYSLFFAK